MHASEFPINGTSSAAIAESLFTPACLLFIWTTAELITLDSPLCLANMKAQQVFGGLKVVSLSCPTPTAWTRWPTFLVLVSFYCLQQACRSSSLCSRACCGQRTKGNPLWVSWFDYFYQHLIHFQQLGMTYIDLKLREKENNAENKLQQLNLDVGINVTIPTNILNFPKI